MNHKLLAFFCFLSAACVGTVLSHGLISQSAIYQCDWGDETEPTVGAEPCKQKFVVSMALSSGQGNVESLYANIDKAYQDGNTEMSRLKKPFRLEMRKSEVLASYRAYYRRSVNAKPTEVAFQRRGCLDSWNVPNPQMLACRKQLDSKGRPVWDSQGFCCRCDSIEKLYIIRGNYTCGLIGIIGSRGSAHCMQMHDLWYDVFELDPPRLQYKISLQLLEFNGVGKDPQNGQEFVNWTTVSTFSLTPARTLSRSKNGRVVAELEGDLLGARGPHDLSYKYLLIPSIRVWPNNSFPEQYTNGPRDWMLLDQNLVDLSGMECNKVGVSYSGFRRQTGKCNLLQQSCFTNQPLDFWRHDNIRRQRKRKGSYMVHNYGKVHNSSHPNNDSFILKFVHEDLHNSFVTFRIDASNLLFVYNVGKGRIVETYSTDVQALSGMGELTAEIQNTGEVTAEFSVSVMRCTGTYRMPAKSVSVDPGRIVNVTFKVQSFDNKGGMQECEVQLFDSQFNLLQTAKVDFKVKSTCFCYGACGCTCGEDEPIMCPTAPPIEVEGGSLAVRILLLTLESIGAEGFIGFFGGLFLFLGCMKLSLGGVICCRKTKAQEYADRMKEKGAPPKGPQLVRCSGECRGAQAAKARYKRKVERLRQMGKSPHRLDDWRNTSYVCSCQSELVDIRFIHVIKAVCFFYYCFFLPFAWLGKKVWWSVFRDTAVQKEKAERAVLNTARKKGKLEDYGIVDLGDELRKLEEGTEEGPNQKKSTRSATKSKANEEAISKAIDSLVTKKVKLPPSNNTEKKSKKDKAKRTKKKEKKNIKAVSGKEHTTLEKKQEKKRRNKHDAKETGSNKTQSSDRRGERRSDGRKLVLERKRLKRAERKEMQYGGLEGMMQDNSKKKTSMGRSKSKSCDKKGRTRSGGSRRRSRDARCHDREKLRDLKPEKSQSSEDKENSPGSGSGGEGSALERESEGGSTPASEGFMDETGENFASGSDGYDNSGDNCSEYHQSGSELSSAAYETESNAGSDTECGEGSVCDSDAEDDCGSEYGSEDGCEEFDCHSESEPCSNSEDEGAGDSGSGE